VPEGSDAHLSGKRSAAQWITTFGLAHGGDVSIGKKKPGRSAGEGLCFLKQREHLGGVSKVDFADCGRLCAGETCGL